MSIERSSKGLKPSPFCLFFSLILYRIAAGFHSPVLFLINDSAASFILPARNYWSGKETVKFALVSESKANRIFKTILVGILVDGCV